MPWHYNYLIKSPFLFTNVGVLSTCAEWYGAHPSYSGPSRDARRHFVSKLPDIARCIHFSVEICSFLRMESHGAPSENPWTD
jgi:hypothetical protein